MAFSAGGAAHEAFRLRAHDLTLAFLAILFAAFSVAWPGTGSAAAAGFAIPRGYLMAVVYLGIALLSLLVPFGSALCSERSGGRGIRIRGRALGFLRTYYPQAFLALFFTDSILLSAQAMGGVSHDAFFEAADQAIFGFQPAREFSRSLGSLPWVNEIMFGVYFAYFPFMITAVWIPYFKGDRSEGERQLFTVCATVAVVCTWYVFFRVQGPKYWLPDLRKSWYDGIEGGFFVALFKRSLANATLSGAAFPSTHVILTLTTLALAYRNDRRYFAVYLPIAALILCSTVYIRAHWASDIIGGMLVACLLAPFFYRHYGVADRLAARMSGRPREPTGDALARAPRP